MSVFSSQTASKQFSARSSTLRFLSVGLVATLVSTFAPSFSWSSFVGVPSAWAAAKEEAKGDGKGDSKGDGKAHYKSAVEKVKQARYASAIEELKKALKENDKNADFWSLYGFAARKAGSYDLAEKAYARALTLNPNHLGALEYSGELYVETKRMEEARKNLARLTQLCPQGCRERTLLEQAIQGKDNGQNNGQSNDGSHKW